MARRLIVEEEPDEEVTEEPNFKQRVCNYLGVNDIDGQEFLMHIGIAMRECKSGDQARYVALSIQLSRVRNIPKHYKDVDRLKDEMASMRSG